MRGYLTIVGVVLVAIVFCQMGCPTIYHYNGVSNVCGNGICDKGEDPGNCRKDCPMPNLPRKEHEAWPDDHDPNSLK